VFEAADRRIDRENRTEVRWAWMAEALTRRKRLPTLDKLMREIFTDLSKKRFAQAKSDFEDLVKRMGSPPKS